MKIKLAILDSDRNYLEKMRAAFAGRYSDVLEMDLFTSEFAALEALSASQVDVFLLNQAMDAAVDRIPAHCMYAYLSDVPGMEQWKDRPVIFKFQRMDSIFRQIQDVYARNGSQASEPVKPGIQGKTVLFVEGGMGTSGITELSGDMLGAIKDRYLTYLTDGDCGKAEDVLKCRHIVGGVDGLDFSESRAEGKDLYIVVNYTVDYDFPPFSQDRA